MLLNLCFAHELYSVPKVQNGHEQFIIHFLVITKQNEKRNKYLNDKDERAKIFKPFILIFYKWLHFLDTF